MAQFSVMMKATVVLILLNCVIFSHQDDKMHAKWEEMKKMHEDCIAEIGVDPKLVHEAFRDGNFADDAKLKCFMKCVMVKHGSMDADGNIKEKDHDGPHKEEMAEAFGKCKDQKGDDACETAFLFSKCMRSEFKKH